MNEFEFDRLIEMYQMGLLTGKQKKLVEDWLNKPEGETNLSEEDKLLLKRKILNRIRRSGGTIQFVPEVEAERQRSRNRWSHVYKIAASITLVAVFAYVILQYAGSKSGGPIMLTATSSSGVNKVILADGTLVWLKGNSNLIYPSSFSGNARNVSLQGEALFEVAKDARHPFVISCGDLTTTVIGTSFNIKSSDEKIEVVVLSGKVSLTSANDKKGVIVLPNEKVVYDGSKQEMTTKQKTDAGEKSTAIKGTEYMMDFEDSRMSEVIQRIEQKFEIRISVDDAKLTNCMITADFSDQSLETTLSMISQALGFRYDIDGKSVMLTGKGCD